MLKRSAIDGADIVFLESDDGVGAETESTRHSPKFDYCEDQIAQSSSSRPMLRPIVLWGVFKRIKHCRAQASDVAIVARHQRQVID